MKLKSALLFILGLTLAAVPVTAAPSKNSAIEAVDQSVDNIWNDPIFKKQFVAHYGFDAEVEPRVTVEEIELLEKIRPLMAEELPKAEAMLKKAIKADSSAIFDFTLGGIYFQQDKMPEALESYKTAVTKYPSFRRAWRNLGLIYVRDGKHDEAIKAFTRMIELGGGDAYSYGLLGFAYASKQDYQAAEAAFRNALLLQPDNSEWRLGVTRCVFRQEKYADAVTLLEVLIQRFPEKVDFWLLQAQAYIGLKQSLKAAENLEAVDRMGKATMDSLQTLGDIYVTENLVDLAASAYKRAIDTDSTQVARSIQSAETLSIRGALEQARALAEHIKEVADKDMSEVERRKLLKLEARLSMADGSGGEETAKVLEEIIKIDPLDGEALMLLGQHYSSQNEPDRAIFYYERAASIEAFEAKASIRHAQVLVGLGRYSDAVPLLRRAQEVKPHDDIARYLEQVERIAKTHK